MAMIRTDDGVGLHVEETGTGDPILFMHEFGGSILSWEPQVRYFSRRYRCITYQARGWPPSDVPERPEAYSQARAADDAAGVLDGLGIPRAHVVGLSMGGSGALELAIRHPGRAISLIIAAAGSGGSTDPAVVARFRAECIAIADGIERDGLSAMAEVYGAGPARLQLRDKDPRGWAEFKRQFAEGSPRGRALTMRGVMGRREPFFSRAAELAAIGGPMLVIVGDEDDATHELAMHLKRHVARAGVLMLPKTGHAMNLEEPAAFNRGLEDFLHSVEKGRWRERALKPGGATMLLPGAR